MTVTGVKTFSLFCEGTPNSLDVRLLNQLLVGKSPNTQIVPVGGKYGMRAFIKGWGTAAGVVSPPPIANSVAFRDRDFDKEPPQKSALIPYGDNCFLCHRAAVENYVLDAELIHKYWSRNAAEAPLWKHGPAIELAEIERWMSEAASRISHYQATRWALAMLKPGDRWPEVRTTWTAGSGSLPNSLLKDDCLTNATLLVEQFATDTSQVTAGRFQHEFGRFDAMFAATTFIEMREYRVWFHGKDLKKEMQRLRPYGIALDDFCNWGVDNVDWRLHGDLTELASKIPT